MTSFELSSGAIFWLETGPLGHGDSMQLVIFQWIACGLVRKNGALTRRA